MPGSSDVSDSLLGAGFIRGLFTAFPCAGVGICGALGVLGKGSTSKLYFNSHQEEERACPRISTALHLFAQLALGTAHTCVPEADAKGTAI